MKRNLKISKLGYKSNSPYRDAIFLDIYSPNGHITMKDVPHPLLGIDEYGEQQYMLPGGEYSFKGKNIREIPIAQYGGTSYEEATSYTPQEKQPSIADYVEKIEQERKQKEYMKSMQDMYEMSDADDYLPDEVTNEDVVELPIKEELPLAFDAPTPEEEAREAYAWDILNTTEIPRRINNPTLNNDGIQDDVASAGKELQQKFPWLKMTSGKRSWGDKDGHPIGAALDFTGGSEEQLIEAHEYYKNNIVPKYKFPSALPQKHGTGPHIHLGYYLRGGITNKYKTY